MRSTLRRACFFLPVLAGAISACAIEPAGTETDESSAAQSTEALFDVNDVSILFPLKGAEPVPSIPLTTEVGGKPLLSQATLDSLSTFAMGDRDGRGSPQVGFTTAERTASSWRVVALRFDPCAPARPPAKICLVQVRLIAQPFQGNPLDKPVHLVYTLGTLDPVPPGLGISQVPEASMRALLDGLRGIKRASGSLTAGAPLGVHPGLQSEATAPAVSAAIRTFVATAVGMAARRNLAMVAVRDPKTTQGRTNDIWEFFAGDLDANGAFVVQPIPVYGDKTIIEQVSILDPPARRLSPQPPASAISARGLFETRPTEEALKNTFLLDDPRRVDFFTTDCASCHVSTQRAIVNLDRFDPSNPARYAIPPGITAYVKNANLQGSTRGSTEVKWNFRHFGYFGSPSKATVTFRTAYETAEVAKLVNTRFFKASGAFGPGPICTGKEAQVIRCFATGRPDCLASCAPAPR